MFTVAIVQRNIRFIALVCRIGPDVDVNEIVWIYKPRYNRGMLPYLLQGLTLGFAAGAQPGPFQTFLISQTLSRGWRRSWIAAFGPLISDGPIVVLVLLVLSQIPDWFQRVLQIAGGLFVLYLVWGAYKSWRAFTPDVDALPQGSSQNLLRAGLMNALSPGPYLFWSLVMGPLIITAWREGSANAVSIVIGFYLAIVGLNVTLVMIIGQAARFGNRVRKAMLGFSALALAGFGIYQLWQGIF